MDSAREVAVGVMGEVEVVPAEGEGFPARAAGIREEGNYRNTRAAVTTASAIRPMICQRRAMLIAPC